MICGLYMETTINFLAWRAVQVPDLQTEASRFNKSISERGDANIVGFTCLRLNVDGAVCLNVAIGHKMAVVVCMRLDPRTSE